MATTSVERSVNDASAAAETGVSGRRLSLASVAPIGKARAELNALLEALMQEGDVVYTRARETAEDRWELLGHWMEGQIYRIWQRLDRPTTEEYQILARQLEELCENVERLVALRKANQEH